MQRTVALQAWFGRVKAWRMAKGELRTTADGRELSMTEVIRKYLTGKVTMQELAAESGRHRYTLYRWMLEEMGGDRERYREMRNRILVKRIADADEELDGAETAVEVTKRVAQAKFARFDYERRAPEAYGVKQDGGPAVVVHVSIGTQLRDPPAGVVVEQEG